jgi:hypothetical protein
VQTCVSRPQGPTRFAVANLGQGAHRHVAGGRSRFLSVAVRTESPLVGCPEGDALLEVVAFDVGHVAPGSADQRVARSVPPLA